VLFRSIRTGEQGDQLLNTNKVPISHMWSPEFVPKCKDWPKHVDVVGEFRLVGAAKQKSPYSPAPELLAFLNSKGGDNNKPLYIGFGSMVIEKPSKLVEIIKSAAKAVNCYVLLQSGWTKYGEDYEMISDEVMVIGAMPHDWLFDQVSGVVHHGGAGTTSAGLSAGNPTFICPFFGDQHFWAEMVHRAGAGPPGCPITELTAEKLTQAFKMMLDEETMEKAKVLGKKMSLEDGVQAGIESFYKNLPLSNLICEVSIFGKKKSVVARIYCSECGLKMCEEVDCIIHRAGSGREQHSRIPYRPCKWGVVDPTNILSGVSQGLNVAAYEMVGGLYDLFAKPVLGAASGGVTGAVKGAAGGAIGLFARPLKGGQILVQRVIRGAEGGRSKFTDADALNISDIESIRRHKGGWISRKWNKNEPKNAAAESEEDTLLRPNDIHLVDESAKIVEESYCKARKFLKSMLKFDSDGNRSLDKNELISFLKKESAERILSIADADSSGTLTFTELAWQMQSPR